MDDAGTFVHGDRTPPAPADVVSEHDRVKDEKSSKCQPLPIRLVGKMILKQVWPCFNDVIPERCNQVAGGVGVVFKEVFPAIRGDGQNPYNCIVFGNALNGGPGKQVLPAQFPFILAQQVDAGTGNGPMVRQIRRVAGLSRAACRRAGNVFEKRRRDPVQDLLKLQCNLDAGIFPGSHGNAA